MMRVAQLGTTALLLSALSACDAPISDFPFTPSPDAQDAGSRGEDEDGAGDAGIEASTVIDSITFTAAVRDAWIDLEVVPPSDTVVLYPRCSGAPALSYRSGDDWLPLDDGSDKPADCPANDSCEAFMARTPVGALPDSSAHGSHAFSGQLRVTFMFSTDQSCGALQPVTLELAVPAADDHPE